MVMVTENEEFYKRFSCTIINDQTRQDTNQRRRIVKETKYYKTLMGIINVKLI
jgi:hypothetical protein